MCFPIIVVVCSLSCSSSWRWCWWSVGCDGGGLCSRKCRLLPGISFEAGKKSRFCVRHDDDYHYRRCFLLEGFFRLFVGSFPVMVDGDGLTRSLNSNGGIKDSEDICTRICHFRDHITRSLRRRRWNRSNQKPTTRTTQSIAIRIRCPPTKKQHQCKPRMPPQHRSQPKNAQQKLSRVLHVF